MTMAMTMKLVYFDTSKYITTNKIITLLCNITNNMT